jgi:hypothetical protein
MLLRDLPLCGEDLFALIQFEGPRSVLVETVGIEEDWPSEYEK